MLLVPQMGNTYPPGVPDERGAITSSLRGFQPMVLLSRVDADYKFSWFDIAAQSQALTARFSSTVT